MVYLSSTMKPTSRLFVRCVAQSPPRASSRHLTSYTTSIRTARSTSSITTCKATSTWRRNFSTSRSVRGPVLGNPINIPKWVEENGHRLQPPVNNYCVYDDAYTVMIVGGPNERTDYHINETAEWFYQYKGSMLLKVVEEQESPSTSSSTPASAFRDISIAEGDMFYLPPNTPHNPVRFANTVGIVIEQRRPADSIDRLRWYCQNCREQVHEKSFHCTDLGTQLKQAIREFEADEEARRCKNCGTICDTAPRK